MRYIPWALAALLAGCGMTSERTSEAPNRWADERLWPVLGAQEHRDTQRLCALLKNSSPSVREAAALAFASVQDTLGIPCLLSASRDPEASVRRTAVFALGFIADSTAIAQMAEGALTEQDSTVQRALLSASFLAMQRQGLLKDPNAILFYLDEALGHERARAADALRRLPDSTVVKLSAELRTLMASEGPDVRQFLVLAMKKLGTQADTALLYRTAARGEPGERVNAVRVLMALTPEGEEEPLLRYIGDPEVGVRTALIEQLTERPCPPALAGIEMDKLDIQDVMSAITVSGIVSRCAGEGGDALITPELPKDAPYEAAALIAATTGLSTALSLDELLFIVNGSRPSVERQAALQAAIRTVRDKMMRARYTSREAQYGQLGSVLREAMNTGDAGLISAVAEELQKEDADAIRFMLGKDTEAKALSVLAPIRDLEARILLHQVIAKRDGLPPPAHERPPFNHPIDVKKLRALTQGQRYRITTNKGEVIIATDVNECPGSSLAFDSLVTAGYYNGKAFHRMVPNFVAQGGCPRGDGYGGMDWTLRTEIGRTPFTTGSVGLASAGPDTESCQFFITHSATPHLDGRYTRFGEVISGMDVVWKLQMGDVMQRVERAD
jgi:cyclophilin family peptidyl-prolyl cis-trans isomerase/HEAT repeat protein